eukprot:gene19869-25821_t
MDWYKPPWKQPNDLIKEYFGEHIGLYFYFLAFYTTTLLPLSIIGIVSFANAIQVVLLGYVYDDLAKRLNDYENWRTDTEYEDSLISKLFVFNFVNSYFPSFYIAFIKKAIGDKCEANSCMGSIGDYNEVSIQYGFLTLFVAATPFAVFLAYLANYVEIRADGYKLLKYSRRPFPHGAQDIGSWYTVFEIISIISVFTNA